MTADAPYPRDLVGYGAPPARPALARAGAHCRLAGVNYEEGARVPACCTGMRIGIRATDLGAAEALPGARNLNVESNFEYGSRVGLLGDHAQLLQGQVDATVYAVGMALERNPQAAAAIAQSGFEVACHGQRWIDYQFVPEAAERADMLRNIEIITRLTGSGRSAGTPAARARTRAGWWWRAAASSMTAMPTTTICPIGPKSRAGAIWWCPIASTPTTAACSAAGTSAPARTTSPTAAMPSTGSTAWAPRGGRACVARPARPHHRPPRPNRRARAAAFAYPAPRGRVAVHARGHRPALDFAPPAALTAPDPAYTLRISPPSTRTTLPVM